MSAGISARATTLNVIEHGESFTKRVLELLKNELKCTSEVYCSGIISAEQLVKVAEIVPQHILEDRHFMAPTFKDFVEIAKAEPRARFEVYVVTDAGKEERMAVAGTWIPLGRSDLINKLLEKALKEPNETKIIVMCRPTECRYYIRLLWRA